MIDLAPFGGYQFLTALPLHAGKSNYSGKVTALVFAEVICRDSLALSIEAWAMKPGCRSSASTTCAPPAVNFQKDGHDDL